MSEHVNTYEACDTHRNGHSNYCKDCQEEHLRSLLREVANSDGFDVIREVAGLDGGEYMNVFLAKDLWAKLLPLRTPGEVKP